MQRLLNGDIQKCRTDADEHQSGIVYLAISLLTHTQAFGGKGGGFFPLALNSPATLWSGLVGGTHIVNKCLIIGKINAGDIPVILGRPIDHLPNHIHHCGGADFDLVFLLTLRLGVRLGRFVRRGFFPGALAHVGGADRAGGVHKVEEVGFILVAFFIQRLVVVDDDVESVAVPVLHGDELLVGVLVIEQVAGDGVAVLDKARPRLRGDFLARAGLIVGGLGGGLGSGGTLPAAACAVGAGLGRCAFCKRIPVRLTTSSAQLTT